MSLTTLERLSFAVRGEGELEDLIRPETSGGLYVYRMNYLFGHIDALAGKFASLKILLGEENFNFFARKYILTQPSIRENIDCYGEDFHQFLHQCSELEDIFYIQELGKLDLLWFWGRYHEVKSVDVAKGVYFIWEAICENSELKKQEVDMDSTETVCIIEEKGEYFLTLI